MKFDDEFFAAQAEHERLVRQSQVDDMARRDMARREAEREQRLAALTLTRIATDSGNRHSLRDVADKLGIDLNDLDNED